MVPLRTMTVFPQVAEAFDAGRPVNPVAEVSLRIALDDLKWWSDVLEKARAEGQLPPAVLRIQAAAAAFNEVEDEKTEQMREMNVLRDVAMKQREADIAIVKEFIRTIKD